VVSVAARVASVEGALAASVEAEDSMVAEVSTAVLAADTGVEEGMGVEAGIGKPRPSVYRRGQL
jgi:hypothetical protein